MVYFEKSQPAPDCLEKEKSKANGDYKCALKILYVDFKGKCYICEAKGLTSINVEHFKAHKGDKNLKFDWKNLFLACGHCNNIKLDNYEPIIDCTNIDAKIESRLSYCFNPFPYEKVDITAMDTTIETQNTRDLLLAVYNGTTEMKTLEANNLRERLLDDIMDFQTVLKNWYKARTIEEKDYYLMKVKAHLSTSSSFTAFKRGIILKNEQLKTFFGQYFD